ncbi:MAG: lycopene cyclase family protein [Lutimonas sp.]
MMARRPMEYDYIIAGSGCAGLSLLHGMLSDPDLRNKNILVIDKDKKQENDRTWCFWEKEKGPFESIVHHEWKTLEFLTPEFTRKFDLEPYSYKMIRGIDFYEQVIDFASPFDNVDFRFESIESMDADDDNALVKTSAGIYSAPYVFNSTALFHPEMNPENSLLQHFEGWVIRTDKPIFDEKVGTLMDFRLDQKHGTTFMYVLPTSSTEALIEYTLFTEKLLEKEDYRSALKDYIRGYLDLENYEILHTEFGIIPMSLARFESSPNGSDRIINIGTAGGFTKASSGYTFQFIQKHTESIIQALISGNSPMLEPSLREQVYQWYDRTLLDVLLTNKMEGREVFAKIFKKRPPKSILAFLGNESSVWDDLQIMSSLPILPFLTSGIKQLIKR